ncbi:glyoxalase [Halobacillus andaensis]|uniref:Glyoxalase n=1 Tax=Halobacillus andaensis TaxID=1176239 RepID=A0A917EZT9_HALAA|nr:VOC family protein [Halobacillus andaensis]MBP2006376.1 catechol 2,3-dioxygenase-like lactoylglutathione lyase family enzyme [Halobacillus andaensis]GGF34685.1 glyoxalase [Halobacillus andaensis]
MNRVNLITLGVKDMKRSVAFYRDHLGFSTSETKDNPEIIFFNNPGSKLALYPLDELAKDIDEQKPPQRSGFSGITLAYNAKSEQEVDDMMKKAEAAGARLVKPPEKVFWGGYSGYFTDPDGYYWEVAYGEMWEFDESDMLIVN